MFCYSSLSMYILKCLVFDFRFIVVFFFKVFLKILKYTFPSQTKNILIVFSKKERVVRAKSIKNCNGQQIIAQNNNMFQNIDALLTNCKLIVMWLRVSHFFFDFSRKLSTNCFFSLIWRLKFDKERFHQKLRKFHEKEKNGICSLQSHFIPRWFLQNSWYTQSHVQFAFSIYK